MTVGQILADREGQYGNFAAQAEITFQLKQVIASHLNLRQKALTFDQLYALEMICAKVARVINGNPNYLDNWDDIAGYATLVANRLRSQQEKPRPTLDDRQMPLPLAEEENPVV